MTELHSHYVTTVMLVTTKGCVCVGGGVGESMCACVCGGA